MPGRDGIVFATLARDAPGTVDVRPACLVSFVFIAFFSVFVAAAFGNFRYSGGIVPSGVMTDAWGTSGAYRPAPSGSEYEPHNLRAGVELNAFSSSGDRSWCRRDGSSWSAASCSGVHRLLYASYGISSCP